MPQGGTYEALQKGIVHGTFAPIETLKGWKQAEVVKSTTESTAIGYTTAMFVAMNLKKWQSLPPDIQKVLEQVSEEWIDVHARAWDNLDAEGRRYTLSLGNRIIPLSQAESRRWVRGVKPVVSEYIDANRTQGVNPEKAVRDLQASIKAFGKKKFSSYRQYKQSTGVK
jgi:TRAP-type C4-dicarboxylate transport system substrate-binding protein